MEILHKAFLRGIERAFAELPPERIEAFIENKVGFDHLVARRIDKTAKSVALELRDRRATMLEVRQRDRGEFEVELIARWGKVLDALETLIVIALEAGGDFNNESRPNAVLTGRYRVIALTSLHARSCQIAQEVLALLRSGFADGGHARWRSLHELAVVAFVLAEGSEELAEKYMLHQEVESYWAMKGYQSYAARLGQSAYTEQELEAVRRRCEELVQKYGRVFERPRGWTAGLVSKKELTIAGLEKYAKLDHFRPYYQMASHNVHAGSRGATWRLGTRPGSELLLAGPSVYGLGDPAHGTAISLNHCSVALLCVDPIVDRLVALKIMGEVVQEIGEEVKAVHAAMETPG